MSSAVFKLLLLLGHLVEPVPQQHLSLPLSEQGRYVGCSIPYLFYASL